VFPRGLCPVGIRYNRLTVRPIERASSTTCLILLGSIPSLSVGMPIEVVVVEVVNSSS